MNSTKLSAINVQELKKNNRPNPKVEKVKKNNKMEVNKLYKISAQQII